MATINSIRMYCPVAPSSGQVIISASYSGEYAYMNSSEVVNTNVTIFYNYTYVDEFSNLTAAVGSMTIFSGNNSAMGQYPGGQIVNIYITSVSPASSGAQTYTY